MANFWAQVRNGLKGPNLLIALIVVPIGFIGAANAPDIWTKASGIMVGVMLAVLALYIIGGTNAGLALNERLNRRRNR